MRTVFIEDKTEIEAIIKGCRTCFLGLSDSDNAPYVVPMNFGYTDGIIYLHSGPGGRKWDMMIKNPKACVTFCLGDELAYQDEHVACSWRMKSKSVIAEGKLEFIEEYDEKEKIMHLLMAQYSDKSFKFNEPAIKNIGVFKLHIETIQGKAFGTKAITPWNS
jgi:nitroimidazol reductase NimA-like FMN-containing flavoprotein (pyridoxamine 5'-phosphate oxidase superfamily)